METDQHTFIINGQPKAMSALENRLKEKNEEVFFLKERIAQISQELDAYKDELYRVLAADVDTEIKSALSLQRERQKLSDQGYSEASLSKAYGHLSTMAVLLEKRDDRIQKHQQREQMYETALKRLQGQLQEHQGRQKKRVFSKAPHREHASARVPSEKRSLEILLASELFNSEWYLAKYADVAADKHYSQAPVLHYIKYGSFEERDPSSAFSTRRYLQAYPDVTAMKINPLVHFILYGKSEGRSPRP